MATYSRRSMKRHSSLRVVARLLLAVYAGFPGLASAVNPPPAYPDEIPILPPTIPTGDQPKSLTGKHEFTLRHVYHRGTYQHPDLHVKLDVKPDTRLWVVSDETGQPEPISEPVTPLIASSNALTIERLADRRPSVVESYLAYARSSGTAAVLTSSDWITDEVSGPNVTDKKTILTFAKMTANDYIEEPGSGEWQDVSGRFNYSSSFGWQQDGLRGHIYADETNTTVIISLKGTSPALFDGAETTTNDKVNDNLYFSCCCGQGGSYLWRQVCDCYSSVYTGNLTCIVEALHDENRYYRAAIDLYTNVTERYPQANVWLTGHSLGGSMSALLGQTFGLPTVAFEAIPDALPAARLGLPAPPGHDPTRPQTRKNNGIYHVGHTADPIYMGSCNGASSTCTWFGYALESACHTGSMCVYDTVEDKGWRVGIGTHRIRSVISDVLEVYDEVPPCEPEVECYDCELWKFFRSNGSEITTTTTTTTATSMTRTRTSTCKTPGWWGCLDETATTTTTTTTTTSTTATTTTCKTPGWFGCKDLTTTTITTTSAAPSPTVVPTITSTASTTCHDPGWFGCRDSSTTVTSSAPTSLSSTCESPGFFWGCHDTPTSSITRHAITPAPII